MIVCKFGGSSLTKKKSIKNIYLLSKRNKKMIFVFSAVGKQNRFDTKLTDLLIDYAKTQNKNTLEKIYSKFAKLNKMLKLDFCYSKYLKKYVNQFNKTLDFDFFVSRGEYLTSYMFSLYLGFHFVPAEKLIVKKNGQIDYCLLKKRVMYYINKYKKIVVPGFYYYEDKKIKLFSRGGSDLSGAILSKAQNGTVYENWTDVKGIRQVNPKFFMSNQIKKLDYTTLQFMCNNDANVIQSDCAKELINSKTILKVNSIFDITNKPTIVKNKKVKTVSFVLTKQQKNKIKVLVKPKNCPIFKTYITTKKPEKQIKKIYKKFLLKK